VVSLDIGVEADPDIDVFAQRDRRISGSRDTPSPATASLSGYFGVERWESEEHGGLDRF